MTRTVSPRMNVPSGRSSVTSNRGRLYSSTEKNARPDSFSMIIVPTNTPGVNILRDVPTMEWDTAAAHIIATECGRKVLNFETHQPLHYNKENLLNPWFVVE